MKKQKAKAVSTNGSYRCEILVNNRVVWKGEYPKQAFLKLCEKYPDKEISIKCKELKGILIA